jgi:hypothetical protein
MRICFLFGDGIDENPPKILLCYIYSYMDSCSWSRKAYIHVDGHFLPGS